MIDYSTMKPGDVAELPHKTMWEGENRDEYYRAQEYVNSCPPPRPQFEAAQNLTPQGRPAPGFTIRRVR